MSFMKKTLMLITFCMLVMGFSISVVSSTRAEDVPRIERMEYLGEELSQDRNNPTILPNFSYTKLIGNDACVSQTVAFEFYLEGFWLRQGVIPGFDTHGESVAILYCQIPPYQDFPAEIEYNKALAIKYVYQNWKVDADSGIETVEIISESPTYYVQFIHELSDPGDLEVSAIYKYAIITDDQLIIELIPGYHFTNSNITIIDRVIDEEYDIEVSETNPYLTGVFSNKLIYSGFHFKRNQEYIIVIPEGAAISNETFGTERKHKYSMSNSIHTNVEWSDTYIEHYLDVEEDSWEYSYVKELTEKEIINGYEDGTFKPDNLVTRSEFAKMMVAALLIPTRKDVSQTFVDVKSADWDFEYVEAAKPYLTGYFDGRDYYFKGGEPAVREDAAVALVKALNMENKNIDVTELENIFDDYFTISQNLKSYVLIAYKNDIIGGYPDSTFRPQQPITRAEAAALISRVLNSGVMEKVTFDREID